MYCVLYTTTVYMLYCMALKVQLFFFYKIIDMIIKSPNKKHAAAPCWSLVTGHWYLLRDETVDDEDEQESNTDGDEDESWCVQVFDWSSLRRLR